MSPRLLLLLLGLASCTHPLEGVWLVHFSLAEEPSGGHYVHPPSTAELPLWLHHDAGGSFVVDGLVHGAEPRRSLHGVLADRAFSADTSWEVHHQFRQCPTFDYEVALVFDGVFEGDLGIEGELTLTTTALDTACDAPSGPRGSVHRWHATGVFVGPTLAEPVAEQLRGAEFQPAPWKYLLSGDQFGYAYHSTYGGWHY